MRMTMNNNNHIDEAHKMLISLGLPRAQHNERSSLCLLALLNLTPKKTWINAESPLIGMTPIMDWAQKHYDKGIRTQFTRDIPTPDNTSVCRCRDSSLQSRQTRSSSK